MNKFFRLPFELNPFYSYSVLCQPNKENWKVTAFNWICTISDEEKLELVKKMNGEASKISKDFFTWEYPKIYRRGIPILIVRGWGMLTGTGGFRLSAEEAKKVQENLLQYVTDKLNNNEEEA